MSPSRYWFWWPLACGAKPAPRLRSGQGSRGSRRGPGLHRAPRALPPVIGSPTYAFSAMLLSFLIGSAGGSAWAARRASRNPATPGLFAALQIAAALLSLVVLALFDRLPDVFLLGFRVSHAPGFIVALQIVLSIAVMILPAFCLGAALPGVIP